MWGNSTILRTCEIFVAICLRSRAIKQFKKIDSEFNAAAWESILAPCLEISSFFV
jgi:hypothetical protein